MNSNESNETMKMFQFYRSYHEAIETFDDATYGRYVRMLADYAFHGIEPQQDDTLMSMFWTMAKPLIDKSIVRSIAGKSGGQKGKGVSRNVGNQNAAKQDQNNSKSIANQKQNNSKSIADISNDKDKEEDKEIDNKLSINNISITKEISPNGDKEIQSRVSK